MGRLASVVYLGLACGIAAVVLIFGPLLLKLEFTNAHRRIVNANYQRKIDKERSRRFYREWGFEMQGDPAR